MKPEPRVLTSEFVQEISDILAAVQDIHHLLGLSKLVTYLLLVQVRLHQCLESVKLSLPEGSIVDQVEVVSPVCTENLSMKGVQLCKHFVAAVFVCCDVIPDTCHANWCCLAPELCSDHWRGVRQDWASHLGGACKATGCGEGHCWRRWRNSEQH